MAVSRAERREERKLRVEAIFTQDLVASALDLLELTELAWHDCYGEVTPSADMIDAMLLLSQGTIEGLIQAARLGVTDWRDLKVAAEAFRKRT